MLSIVVPTYLEAENLPRLATSIANAMKPVGIAWELVISDDCSPDETEAVCRELCENLPVRLVRPGDRPRDLSLSVIDGIRAARFDRVVVMDADLSHPAERLPEMYAALDAAPRCMIVGSRYVPGGSFDREWSIWRFLNSHVATLLARPLARCQDPMSGYFMFDRRLVPIDDLRPLGYKIGLELMVRGNFDGIREVAIAFIDRDVGTSKMNLGQQFKYLRHLRRLYLHRFGGYAEFLHFGIVGASGFVVDVMCFFLFQLAGINHVVARGLSFLPAVSWNWAMHRVATFGERERRPAFRQWLEFVGASLFGFSVNWSVYVYLTLNNAFFDEYRLLALVAGVGAGAVINFIVSSWFVYNDKRQ